MSMIERHYQKMLAEKSDIQLHLPTLRGLAKPNMLVVEFGFRTGVSTSAFLAGGADVISYDVVPCHPWVGFFRSVAPRKFRFEMKSSLEATILPCDLLFIDSLHTYAQLSAELHRHHGKPKDRIVLHDTFTFRDKDKVGAGPGLGRAVTEFLEGHPEWVLESHTDVCNGLTILRRTPCAS